MCSSDGCEHTYAMDITAASGGVYAFPDIHVTVPARTRGAVGLVARLRRESSRIPDSTSEGELIQAELWLMKGIAADPCSYLPSRVSTGQGPPTSATYFLQRIGKLL